MIGQLPAVVQDNLAAWTAQPGRCELTRIGYTGGRW